MAVLNKRAVVSAIEMYGVSSIRLPKVLGESFDQLIKSVFANNEQGFFYDPNDLSTMFQDAAGTVPVTGAGQPVGLILDKSGRNNHASQTTSASRPILRQNATTGAYYLEFDGSDDFLRTANIDFTATDKISLFTGVRKLSDAAAGILVELSNNSNLAEGSFYFVAGKDLNLIGYTTLGRGTLGWSEGRVASSITYPAPDTAVLSVKHDISGSLSSIRRNGVVGIDGTEDKGTGNFGNYPLYIGRRAGTSLPFNGHLYGLIGIGKIASDGETAAIEKELAKRIGVTLSV